MISIPDVLGVWICWLLFSPDYTWYFFDFFFFFGCNVHIWLDLVWRIWGTGLRIVPSREDFYRWLLQIRHLNTSSLLDWISQLPVSLTPGSISKTTDGSGKPGAHTPKVSFIPTPTPLICHWGQNRQTFMSVSIFGQQALLACPFIDRIAPLEKHDFMKILLTSSTSIGPRPTTLIPI